MPAGCALVPFGILSLYLYFINSAQGNRKSSHLYICRVSKRMAGIASVCPLDKILLHRSLLKS
jgi:hypothetical protein